LGATALIAFFSTIVFSSSKAVGWKQRVLAGIWIVAVVGFFMGGRIAMEIEEVWAERANQQAGMDALAQVEGGNYFVQYVGVAVLAPMIFTMPFPTMITIEIQQNMQMLNGNSFIKNIMSFFTIFGIFLLFYKGKWREHLLILAFLVGYLGVIALSNLGHLERFHLPSIPFALIIAAYAISQMDNQKKKYFNWWTIFVFIAVVGWSWVKLAGRGIM
jgi:hypothetical protein